MKKLLIFIFFFCISYTIYAQDVFNDCPQGGDAKSSNIQKKNELKNRYNIPDKYTDISLETLLNSKVDVLDETEAVSTSGYVLLVKDGGIESCNCHSTIWKDTHIELVLTADETDKSKGIIVEITPRLRTALKKSGIDWSTKSLKNDILGKKVTIYGYLFCDSEHEPNSQIDNPNGKNNWRGSCYEIHPITKIDVEK